jgi:hypothetical protein
MSTRAHQGNTYRKNRRDIGAETKKAVSCDERKMADLTGYAPKTCQYFVLDRVMCGEPGFPYCPEHHAVCYRPTSGEAA